MTEEYKNNVLRQLTGQVVENTGNDRPQFITTDNGADTLNAYITEQGYTGNFDLCFSYTRNNQQLLFYTVNREDPGAITSTSFIVITDMDLQPLGIIKKWKSQTDFRMFLCPLSNDLGDGRIYFIDADLLTAQNPRLVYMNDPTSKKVGDDYEVEMLYTYTLPISSTTVPLNLAKNPDGANFVISCYNTSTTKLAVNELVINVGSANEWNSYVYGTNVGGFSGNSTLYPIWTEELDCRFCFADTTNGLEIKVLNTNNSGGTLSLVLQSTIPLPSEAQEYSNRLGGLTMKNYNYLYCFSQGTLADDGTSNFYEVDLNNETMTALYSTPYYSSYNIQLINGEIFFTRQSYIPAESTDYYYFGMIAKGEYYDIYITSSTYLIPQLFIVNSYNLYSIRILDETGTEDTIYKLYLIYNSLNYNGTSFNGIQSVISNSVVLNNEDGLPIFARNLYNKTINQNTVESTVEIPAYQLNGINIAEQKLLSKNNNNIIYQYNDIEKNIYEIVLMNFFNTLTIIDNNENKNKVMTSASNYFVNGLETQDYNDIKALKFKVTYTDDSTYTSPIAELSINGTTATMGFMFYSGVGVSSVEILSNDESITYATVDETFDPSSYYKVVQEVVIN